MKLTLNQLLDIWFMNEKKPVLTLEDIVERRIEDGVYWSKSKPEVYEQNYVKTEDMQRAKEVVPKVGDAVMFDTEQDYFAIPYETHALIIWRNEEPEEVAYEGDSPNYGAALYIPNTKSEGYYIILAEND